MSNSSKYSTADQETNGVRPPAIIHKRILSVAAEHQEKTPTQIASRVSGASIQLVEKVLAEYGDFNVDSSAPKTRNSSQGSPAASNDVRIDHSFTTVDPPAPTELTTKQQQTLYQIYEQPNATQSDLADVFDVSRTSISHRLNNVEGFKWGNRQEFVKCLFDNEINQDSDETRVESAKTINKKNPDMAEQTDPKNGPPPTNETPTESTIGSEIAQDDHALIVNSALAHKVLHACFDSEHITENEELKLLQGLLSESDGSPVD